MNSQLLVTRKIYFQNTRFSKHWHAHSSWDGKAAPKQSWAAKQAVQLQVSPSWPPAGRQAQSHPTEHVSGHGMTMGSTTPAVWVPYPTLLLLQSPGNKNKHKGQLWVGREGVQLQLPLKLASAVFCAFIQWAKCQSLSRDIALFSTVQEGCWRKTEVQVSTGRYLAVL